MSKVLQVCFQGYDAEIRNPGKEDDLSCGLSEKATPFLFDGMLVAEGF